MRSHDLVAAASVIWLSGPCANEGIPSLVVYKYHHHSSSLLPPPSSLFLPFPVSVPSPFKRMPLSRLAATVCVCVLIVCFNVCVYWRSTCF